MSWAVLLTFGAISYALKAVGPLLAALIVVQTLADGRRLAIDARAAALAVATVLAWRRAPFLVVVVASAVTAAVLRALG